MKRWYINACLNILMFVWQFVTDKCRPNVTFDMLSVNFASPSELSFLSLYHQLYVQDSFIPTAPT